MVCPEDEARNERFSTADVLRETYAAAPPTQRLHDRDSDRDRPHHAAAGPLRDHPCGLGSARNDGRRQFGPVDVHQAGDRRCRRRADLVGGPAAPGGRPRPRQPPTMSDSPPPTARSGAITALMLLAAINLLLPGLCAGFSAVAFSFTLQELSNSPLLVLLWIALFTATAGGIALIRHALGRWQA